MTEKREMIAEIQSAQAYEPRFCVITFAVDWPVNCARLETDQIAPVYEI